MKKLTRDEDEKARLRRAAVKYPACYEEVRSGRICDVNRGIDLGERLGQLRQCLELRMRGSRKRRRAMRTYRRDRMQVGGSIGRVLVGRPGAVMLAALAAAQRNARRNQRRKRRRLDRRPADQQQCNRREDASHQKLPTGRVHPNFKFENQSLRLPNNSFKNCSTQFKLNGPTPSSSFALVTIARVLQGLLPGN